MQNQKLKRALWVGPAGTIKTEDDSMVRKLISNRNLNAAFPGESYTDLKRDNIEIRYVCARIISMF